MNNDRKVSEEKEAVLISVGYKTQMKKIFKSLINRVDYLCLAIKKRMIKEKRTLRKIKRISLKTILIA